ncbi:MauE/DoxX family redox-associated membrane protein [Pedobacter nutrimenti]|uniref:MauE/DoxX family redox-associated membrane protein n=1 Tax=Pedobacter nutrimenti TaxID=1241337 RepID=UPI00292D8568|nr:MauE/DoxX family redox-associated membrane protein [Pedobacter nutrimenti]
MKSIKKSIFTEVICASFILLFVYAAVSKIRDFERFSVELSKSPILNPIASWVVIAIPSIEIALSIFLIVKRFRLAALYASFSLMVMFSAYIVAILKFSSYIPCTCGGVLQNMSWKEHLIFNLCFVVLGTIGVLMYPAKVKILSAQ